MSKKVLITGCSSGFGRLTAETLRRRGHTVVAAMRDPQGRNKSAAEKLRACGALVTEIDVSDDQSVARGAAWAIKEAGGLDVLVNNAGIGVCGVQETFTIEDWKKLFDINLFGALLGFLLGLINLLFLRLA